MTRLGSSSSGKEPILLGPDVLRIEAEVLMHSLPYRREPRRIPNQIHEDASVTTTQSLQHEARSA